MKIVNGKAKAIEDAPAAALFRSAVWDHSGFSATLDDRSKKVVDKTVTGVVYANSNTPKIGSNPALMPQ